MESFPLNSAPFWIGAGIGLIIGFAIAAVFLRSACSIYNSFVGGEDSDYAVPSPGFGTAMGIVFVNATIGTFVGFAIGIGIRIAMRGDKLQALLVSQLVSVPIGLIVASGILAAMLPTTFLRAVAVQIIQTILVALVAVAVAALIYFVYLQK